MREDKTIFLRPKTRGELLNALKQNIKCEVVASNEEFTSLSLQSLTILDKSDLKFKTTPSKNEGWVIYEAIPNMRAEALQWWNSLGFQEQADAWEQWKVITNDSRKLWLLIEVDKSSSTIEKIWRELINKEILIKMKNTEQIINLTLLIDEVQYGISDEPIEVGDYFINKSDNTIYQSKGYGVAIGVDKKVICSSNPKDTRFPFLVMPSKEQEGELICKNLLNIPDEFMDGEDHSKLEFGIKCFNSNPAKYTEKQLRQAFVQGMKVGDDFDSFESNLMIFLQSLQPTAKAVRVERVEIRSPEFGNCPHFTEVGCIKDICTCYTFKIKVEQSPDCPQGIVKALEVIY